MLCRCGPCRAVFPHLSEMQQRCADKGLVVIGISLEEDSPQLDTFVNRQKMDYTVAVSQQCDSHSQSASHPASAAVIPRDAGCVPHVRA